MRPDDLNPARRALLMRSAEVAGLVTLAAVGSGSRPAAAKASKGDFMYQDHGHDGKTCGQCKFFSADGTRSDSGSCSIVEGTISREGWCAAFAAKVPG